MSLTLSQTTTHKTQSIFESLLVQSLNIDATQMYLDDMHKDVKLTPSRSRLQAIESHNSKTHVIHYKHVDRTMWLWKVLIGRDQRRLLEI